MDELIGKRIENYKVISVLGQGGMGVVYQALDEKLNRKVAIKVLNSSQIANKAQVIERFKNEARNHAQLLHQNIVTVYGFIEFNNQFAIVMEYVEGESLDKVIVKNKCLHIYDVVYIVDQLLEGIGFAHSRGYIHRDIKPSNIIVNSDGVVKIMDFGISKSLYEDLPSTKTGSRVGTIYYMSPEQIRGSQLTTLTDIYSIGCTIYEMLSGFPPFYDQSDFDVMDGHLHKQLQPIGDVSSKLFAEVNFTLNKLMKKNPAERYQSCNEVAIAIHFLYQYLEESKSEPDYFVQKKRRNILSRKKSILGFSSVILIFIVLIVFVFYEVKDFMEYKGYTIFESGDIKSITSLNIDSSFSFSSNQEFGTTLALNSGCFNIFGSGTIIGDSGLVFSYDQDEFTWRKRNLANSSNLRDIHLFKDGKYFIVGDSSTFLSGSSQNELKSFSIVDKDFSFYSIDFIDQNIGLIVGSKGIMLRTIDNGRVWERISTNNSNTLFDVNFDNERTGYAIGLEGTILKTSNFGESWEEVDSDTDKYLKSISFYNNEIGLIVGGSGTILRTEDGGNSWKKVNSISDHALNKVMFVTEDLALITGNLGTVLISRDLGKTWKIIEPKYFNNWNEILVKSGKRIYLIGDIGRFVELREGAL